MSGAATKTCSKCGEVKAVELFRRDRNQCKGCSSIEYKVWYEKNIQYARGRAAQWSKDNAEKRLATRRKFKEDNPEKHKANLKRYREKSREKYPEKHRVASAKWALENPEKRKAIARKSAIANREKKNAQSKRARQQNPAIYKDYFRRKCENLDDSYVKQLVASYAGISTDKVPKQLIEVKRKHLQILRAIKETKNER